MNWNAKMIGRAISMQTLNRRCVLLVPNTTWPGDEADILGVTLDLRLIDIEIKISRSDFKADAAKGKWWHSDWSQYSHDLREPKRTRIEWPRKVWKHYIAMPRDIWKPELVEFLPSPKSGVLLLSEGRGYDRYGNHMIEVACEKRATPNRDAERLTAEQVIDVARLASLRMWEAFVDVERARKDMRKMAESTAGGTW